MKNNIKKIAAKLLVLPIYALYLCIVIYFIGDAKDVWEKWVFYINKIIDKNGKKKSDN